MNTYTRTADTQQGSRYEAGTVEGDAFSALVTDREAPLARVNVSLSQSLGAVKVGASVTLDADQNEHAIERAAELAREKTLELLRHAFADLGYENAC
jgi:hypothetical protein